MGRYRGVDLDFGEYNRPSTPVEHDFASSRGGGDSGTNALGRMRDLRKRLDAAREKQEKLSKKKSKRRIKHVE